MSSQFTLPGSLGRFSYPTSTTVDKSAPGSLGRYWDAVVSNSTIAGYDVEDLIDWETFRKSESLGEFQRRATASFTLYGGGVKPQPGMEVIIYLPTTSNIFFAGRITNCPERDIGYNELGYEVSCVDYTADLDRADVVATFNSTTSPVQPTDYNLSPYSSTYDFKTIARWLIDEKVNKDANTGTAITPAFTYANLDAGGNSPLPPMQFNRTPVSNCLDIIAQMAGAYWYVGYSRDLHGFFGSEGNCPYVLSQDMTYFEDLQIDIDGSQIRNRIIVQGAVQRQQYTDYLPAAVGQRSFTLPHSFLVVGDVTSVKINTGAGYGAALTQAAYSQGDIGGGSAQAYIDPDANAVHLETVFATAGTIEVIYVASEPILVVVQDPAAQAELAALTGTNGIKEYFLPADETITNIDAAIMRGQAELTRYARPQIRGSVTCHKWGAEVGQILQISYAARDQDGTVQREDEDGNPLVIDVLIQQIDFEMHPCDPSQEAEYFGVWRLTFGAPLLGLQQILGQLLLDSRRRSPLQTEILQHVIALSEQIKMAEGVISPIMTLNSNLLFTWGSAGNDPFWDFGQWT